MKRKIQIGIVRSVMSVLIKKRCPNGETVTTLQCWGIAPFFLLLWFCTRRGGKNLNQAVRGSYYIHEAIQAVFLHRQIGLKELNKNCLASAYERLQDESVAHHWVFIYVRLTCLFKWLYETANTRSRPQSKELTFAVGVHLMCSSDNLSQVLH